MYILNWKKALLGAAAAGLVSLGILGCEQEGPAERAGEKIDEAVEDAGEAMEKAGDKIREQTN